MARTEKRLSTAVAKTLSKPGRHADGGGMYLAISPDGRSKTWAYLFTWAGKAKEMGLGAYPAVTLADAREARDKWRRVLAGGQNPIEVRRTLPGNVPTFGACATQLIASKASQWRSARHRDQWRETLEDYAKPLAATPIDRVDTPAVLKVLRPLWEKTPETASRLRGRIEAVLDYAKAHGFRSGDNPAAWGKHLKHVLPKRPRLVRGHHAALPYKDMPRFIARLRERQADSEAAIALEFIIVTAARTGEVLGATWSEIDLINKVWTIPARRMKSGVEHRVPLSERAIELLQGTIPDDDAFLFPGQVRGKSLWPGACSAVVKAIEPSITAHGFRSSFRDWAGNETDFPREIAEAALAHAVGDQSERAYRRSDALTKRRVLMDTWARFIEPAHRVHGNVVRMR